MVAMPVSSLGCVVRVLLRTRATVPAPAFSPVPALSQEQGVAVTTCVSPQCGLPHVEQMAVLRPPGYRDVTGEVFLRLRLSGRSVRERGGCRGASPFTHARYLRHKSSCRRFCRGCLCSRETRSGPLSPTGPPRRRQAAPASPVPAFPP